MNREPDERQRARPRRRRVRGDRRGLAPGGRRAGLAGRRPAARRAAAHSAARRPRRASPAAPVTGRTGPSRSEFEHFVPPEPPPLPRIGPPARGRDAPCSCWACALVIAPGVVGVSNVYGLPLGLLTLAAGLGWLVLRLWPAPPDERDGDDDGAQL